MTKRVFMYATHPTLVDHESLTFYKRGFDVYTAAWATNTRSMYKDALQIELNPKHPYQGYCDFLSDDEISVLSKIDVNMVNSKWLPDVQKVLSSKFDVLYVSQITPWLMLYSEEFLKQGKPVIFRTFGYPLKAWGEPNNWQKFLKYPTFYIVPTDPKEVEIGVFGNNKVYQILTSMYRELVNVDKRYYEDKFALSINQITDQAEDTIREQLGKVIKWVIVDRNRDFITRYELDKLFDCCYFFLDTTENLLRYSTFEAIFHNKPLIVYRGGDMDKFMVKTGFSSGINLTYAGYTDYDRLKFYVNSPGAMNQLFAAEKHWVDGLITETEERWDKFFEECIWQNIA